MNYANKNTTDSYERLVKLASLGAVLLACTLVVSKLVVWWLSGSAALLASATDSILDAFASISSFIILRISLMPADHDHRFGHGKAENLAALLQSSFVFVTAILLVIHGVDRINNPEPIAHSHWAIMVSVLAIVLTLCLVLFQQYVVRKTQSVAISADSLHYQSDLLLNLGVVVAVILAQYGMMQADGIFAVLIGIYLAYGVVKIVINSIDDLMDKELPAHDVQLISQIIHAHEGVIGFHELRTRQSGKMRFVQFHLELDGQLPLEEAHAIADGVEQKIHQQFEHVEVFIHQDPVNRNML